MNSRFAIFIAIIQSILFFGHWLLYISLIVLLDIPESPLRTCLALAISVLSISFVTASIFSFRSDSILVRWYYSFSATWLGFLHCLILGALAGWTVYLVSELLGSDIPTWQIGLPALVAGFGLGLFALLRTYSPRVTKVSIAPGNLPENWRGKRLVFASDLHLGHIRRGRFARRIARKIQEIQPELIFIGGDLFDGSHVDAESVMSPLKELAATNEVFFITGNHELFSGRSVFVDHVREAGMTVLNDEKVEREGLQIAGIDWETSRHPERMTQALQKMALDSNRSTVLLVHSPDRLETAANSGVAIQLSGHTHRGQLWPFSLIADRVYKGHAYGLHKFGEMFVYTCSGTGTWGPPMRLGSPSEIVEITLG